MDCGSDQLIYDSPYNVHHLNLLSSGGSIGNPNNYLRITLYLTYQDPCHLCSLLGISTRNSWWFEETDTIYAQERNQKYNICFA